MLATATLLNTNKWAYYNLRVRELVSLNNNESTDYLHKRTVILNVITGISIFLFVISPMTYFYVDGCLTENYSSAAD